MNIARLKRTNSSGMLIALALAVGVVMALVVGLSVTASQPSPAQTASKPNIIFILTDDMKARELQYMPNTESLLADKGVRFTEAYVTRSLCCPSRATILRGQYAHNHKVWTNVNPSGGFWNFYDQDLDKSTIATWLNAAGYDTVLIGKYLNRYGLDRNGNYSPDTYVPPGWNEWHAWEGNYNSDDTYDINEWKSSDGPPPGHIVTYQRAQIHDTDLHAAQATNFITEHVKDPKRNDTPFFMYLAPNAPHAPAYYAPEDATKFSNAPLPMPSSFNEADVSDKPQWVQDKPLLSSAQISDMRRFYRNRLRALQSVDRMVKQLVDTLSAQKDPLTGKPLIDNTYIVFTSDNGIYLGEHRLQNKAAAYNAAPSVPLVIRGPGVPEGKTRSKIALNNDFAPTFASWAGVTPPAFVDGRSLEPLLTESPPASWRSGGFLVEHRRAPEEYDYVRDIPNYDALRTAQYHYVEYETGERELYDASTDPTELTNIYNSAPEALRSELEARLEALKRCAGSNCRTAEDDITPPDLALPDDIIGEATGPDGAEISWPPPTATDEDPANPEVTCIPPSGSTFRIGETTVTCTATDTVGNKAQGSFNVTIRDTTPPTIGGVPADITEEATGPNGAKVSWQPPTATDAVDGSVGVQCSSDSGLTSGDTFPLGTTRINCEATDQVGNKAIETFRVIVSDTTPPQIEGVPVEPISVTATSAQGATVTYQVPMAIDAVDGDVPVRCAPDTSTLFPLGITTVRCTATDSRANTATASFEVSIIYAWSGVLQPINSDGSSIFKFGSTVPVKFRLTGESAGISDATAKLYVSQVSNGIAGSVVEAVSTSAATEGNLFRYDAESDQYVFNWSTRALQTGRGTYQLRIDLGDGTTNTVLVSLR